MHGRRIATWRRRRSEVTPPTRVWGIRSAARALDLGFVSLLNEQYDLVIPRVHFQIQLLQSLLALLQDPDFRQDVAALGGYDVGNMGKVRML